MASLKTDLETRGWSLMRSLGEGGQARVHLVKRKDEAEDGLYAIKVLRNVNSQQAYDRFYREIEAVKRVRHTGIVSVVDHSNEQDTLHYYVMDYVEGAKPLKALIGSDESPFRGNALRSVEFFIHIVEAIQACEGRNGVVHRDLSPANVLVLPNGRPRIIDFGCCYIANNDHITLTDENVGTPNYRAPECEAFAKGVVDSRADLYSAGKILWATITNQNVFPREAIWEREELTMHRQFPRQPETWHLHDLFQGTIRVDPNRRLSDASTALKEARNVFRLIQSQYLPLEAIGGGGYCPLCGHKTLQEATKGAMRVGDVQSFCPRGMTFFVCGRCGHGLLTMENIRTGTLDGRKNLS